MEEEGEEEGVLEVVVEEEGVLEEEEEEEGVLEEEEEGVLEGSGRAKPKSKPLSG